MPDTNLNEHHNRILVNKEKPYDATFNGQPIDWDDLYKLHLFYEASCTAEWAMENYPGLSGEDAMKLGYEARRQMDKYGYEEEEAIEEAAKTEGIDLGEKDRDD